nr:MAG TPA: hypothetical protein [Caudoviricetes sp.]
MRVSLPKARNGCCRYLDITTSYFFLLLNSQTTNLPFRTAISTPLPRERISLISCIAFGDRVITGVIVVALLRHSLSGNFSRFLSLFLHIRLTHVPSHLRVNEHTAMRECKLRGNLGIVQHSNENIRLFGDILIITASKADFQAGQFQVQVCQITANTQNQFQKFLFGLLKHQLTILGSRFGSRPTVTHNNSGAGIAGGRTTVAVRHTTDRQNRVIHMVNERLRLALVQLCGEIFDLGLELRVNVLILDCALLTELGVIGRRNIDIVEKHKCLHKLLHAVKAVGVHIIHCVQQRKHDLKSTKARIVQRIFDDGNSQYLFLGTGDLKILDLKVPVLRIYAENTSGLFLLDIFHAHEGRGTERILVHHEGETRVECKQLKGSFIFLHIGFAIRKNHAVRSAANVCPLRQLLILSSFILGENIIVQFSHTTRNSFVISTTDILDRFTHQITDLEGNNFICPVFNNNILDFRPDFLFATQHGLSALVVAIEIFDLTLIPKVRDKGFPQNINHIVGSNFRHIGINDSAPKQSTIFHGNTPFFTKLRSDYSNPIFHPT